MKSHTESSKSGASPASYYPGRRCPRGKYNGQRIGGFEVKITINAFRWGWFFEWRLGNHVIQAGPFQIRFETTYE